MRKAVDEAQGDEIGANRNLAGWIGPTWMTLNRHKRDIPLRCTGAPVVR
jgi:hypothetical protein